MDAKIAIETLDLYYSEFHALKNINMRIPEKGPFRLRQIDTVKIAESYERLDRRLPHYW